MGLKRYTYVSHDLLAGERTETTSLELDAGDPTSVEELFLDVFEQQSTGYKVVSSTSKWDGDFMVAAELKMRTLGGRTIRVTFGS